MAPLWALEHPCCGLGLGSKPGPPLRPARQGLSLPYLTNLVCLSSMGTAGRCRVGRTESDHGHSGMPQDRAVSGVCSTTPVVPVALACPDPCKRVKQVQHSPNYLQSPRVTCLGEGTRASCCRTQRAGPASVAMRASAARAVQSPRSEGPDPRTESPASKKQRKCNVFRNLPPRAGG